MVGVVYRVTRACIAKGHAFLFFFLIIREERGECVWKACSTNLTAAYRGLARFYNVFLVIYTLQQRAHECVILTRRLS